jgi:serine/threonine protein kinase
MSDDKTLPVNPSDDDATLPVDSATASGIGSDAQIGITIGPYRLISRLGEGGMGEVFLAGQTEPIKRRVALKVIKPGMDSRAVVARFEAERQALALMDHPCIARVIDAGATERGRPYFVMEYVAGERITKYCDRYRLDTKQRLELFIQVCGGVQHAHQKAVIHRDLKPSNIMVTEVDGKPAPKIIDFGVAKAAEQPLTDCAMHTLMGHIVGTPEYMSPEQADAMGMDVDTRTDVYALGVVLYELLSGTQPFSSARLREAGVEEIQRIIREVDPPRPSTRISSLGDQASTVSERRHTVPRQLSHDLRGDLDWITMKALAKERDRRYDTANGLAMDLGRFLNHEPVIASPPSPAYRLRKLVRRNRAAVAALAAVMAVLAVAVVVRTSLYLRAERESERARTQSAKATQVPEFLTGMLAGVGPAAARGRDTTMLQGILAETDKRLGQDLVDQPEVEAELRDVLATTSADLGDFVKADSLLSWSDSLVSARLGSGSVEAFDGQGIGR